MQSENFDNRVKQAAEQHHPNYDEKAWSKMEKLLDQHLPEKKDDRRRVIFLLLFVLLLGGGAWLIIRKPWEQPDRSAGVTNTANKIQTPVSSNSTVDQSSIHEEIKSTPSSADNGQGTAPARNIDASNPTVQPREVVGAGAIKSPAQRKTFTRKQDADNQLTVDQTNPAIARQKKNDQLTGDKDRNDNTNISSLPLDQYKDVNAGDNKIAKDEPIADNAVAQNKTTQPAENKTDDHSKKPAEAKAAKKKGASRKNEFFFSFSAGPDLSAVSMENPGKVKLLAGAGAGFTFHNRWTIRTGFYASNKVYTASKYDYKPTTPVVNPNYLDGIDADCKVYEIPLNLSYNFSRSEKHSFFATTGLSSFIMKKEEYTYFYKWPGNPPTTYTYTKTINNENQHYFSILTLSGGYEYRFNKRFSLSAEPYLKLPLAGIGFGKVKLSSTGVLFSANIKPFH